MPSIIVQSHATLAGEVAWQDDMDDWFGAKGPSDSAGMKLLPHTTPAVCPRTPHTFDVLLLTLCFEESVCSYARLAKSDHATETA
jgi:hypothetical protein